MVTKKSKGIHWWLYLKWCENSITVRVRTIFSRAAAASKNHANTRFGFLGLFPSFYKMDQQMLRFCRKGAYFVCVNLLIFLERSIKKIEPMRIWTFVVNTKREFRFMAVINSSTLILVFHRISVEKLHVVHISFKIVIEKTRPKSFAQRPRAITNQPIIKHIKYNKYTEGNAK